MIVNPLQVREQNIVLLLVFFHENEFQLGVEVLDERRDLLVLHEQVVAARDVLHDMAFDFIVLKDREATVDENRWMRRLEVCTEIWRRLLHVNGCHLRERERVRLSHEALGRRVNNAKRLLPSDLLF